jgi:integrase
MSRRGPHEGSIYQRKDGRWEGAVHMGYENGRRVRKFAIGRSRAEVATKLAAILKARDEHRPVPDQRTKLGPFLRQWLDEVARPTIRASTYSSYEGIVRVHLVPGLGRILLAKLTPAEVQEFLNAKLATGLSTRRVAYIHAVLRRSLVIAERWGLVSRNVAKLVDPPRVRRFEIRPLTPTEARQLLDAAVGDRLEALYVTALATGLRQGELLGLRWDDLDLEACRLSVRHTLARVDGRLTLLEPKTERSRRTVILSEVAATSLHAHRTRQRMERLVAGSRWADSGHVFTTTAGTPIDAAMVTRAFASALKRAGLPRSRFHDLRHATATYLLAQGFTLEDVKNLLGHSSITLTSNTYGHVLEQRQRQVAASMDLVLGADASAQSG